MDGGAVPGRLLELAAPPRRPRRCSSPLTAPPRRVWSLRCAQPLLVGYRAGGIERWWDRGPPAGPGGGHGGGRVAHPHVLTS